MGVIKEICFIIQTPLTQRDYQRYGVDQLIGRGYQVSFLDFSRIFNLEGVLKNIQRAVYEHIFVIQDKEDLNRFFISKRSADWVLIDLTERREILELLGSLITEYRIPFGISCTNSVPLVQYQPLFRKIVSLKAWAKLLGRMSQKMRNSKYNSFAPQFIIAGAICDKKKFPRVNENTKIVWAHTLDYDLFLDYQRRKPSSPMAEKYMVFLDECCPFHPDYAVEGNPANPFRSPAEYYDELNQELSMLEEKFKMQVVIAAHPRAPYDTMPNLFGGRRVLKGKTIDLVAHSECVLAHSSTAINFAVLFRKPIIFLMPTKVKGGYYGRFITNFARHFNKRPWDKHSLRFISNDEAFKVDDRDYINYRELYIKKLGTPEKFFWDIVADEFQPPEIIKLTQESVG